MHVLIDDQRGGFYDVIIRKPKIAIDILKTLKGKITILYIDYDMGVSEYTGLDILKKALAKECLPDIIRIVSTLPVGVEKLTEFLLENDFEFDLETFRFEKKGD